MEEELPGFVLAVAAPMVVPAEILEELPADANAVDADAVLLILWVVHAVAGRSLAAVPERAAGVVVDAVVAVRMTGGLKAPSVVAVGVCTGAAVRQVAQDGSGVGL